MGGEGRRSLPKGDAYESLASTLSTVGAERKARRRGTCRSCHLAYSARWVLNDRHDVIGLVARVASHVRQCGFRTVSVTSSGLSLVSPRTFGMVGAERKMSGNSERKSQSPPSTHAFSGEDLESDRVDQAWGTDGKSTESEGMVEGLIVEKSSAGEEEQSISFGAEAYREMKRNYTGLEAVANRVLGITQALEVSSSGRGEASGSGTLVVASGGVNVPMGVQPLLGEWPGADHRSQWFGRELWDVGKLLAFLTLLGEDALVNLPEDVVAFVLGQAPKVGEAEASLV
ncbi:Hypothetical predicted protein [Prunus dulcis]|uniref:Uncharacterized protein n=1 Tax=Prunus dulcis TaxID=3755 RepID=A0A5E4GI93_PRUDU|nr:Hypothetical predicted protein [Prunus dulcis]